MLLVTIKSACRKRSPRLASILDGLRACSEVIHMPDNSQIGNCCTASGG
jgi:hypothetical protein